MFVRNDLYNCLRVIKAIDAHETSRLTLGSGISNGRCMKTGVEKMHGRQRSVAVEGSGQGESGRRSECGGVTGARAQVIKGVTMGDVNGTAHL